MTQQEANAMFTEELTEFLQRYERQNKVRVTGVFTGPPIRGTVEAIVQCRACQGPMDKELPRGLKSAGTPIPIGHFCVTEGCPNFHVLIIYRAPKPVDEDEDDIQPL